MNNLQYPRRWWSACKVRGRAALVVLGAAMLAACGSGGVMSGTSPAGMSAPTSCTTNCGAAVVSLTDAPGDFLSYIVNVVSLQLTRSDGTVVQTIPVTTKVDFAQLVNLSEIVSTSQIPAGSYTSASMTLDYGSATIVVDNGTTGVTIAAGNIIDGSTSKPLQSPNTTQMTVSLTLPSNAPLVITPGKIAHLALDFNLAASNAITPPATDPTTVTVNPVLTGSLVPDATKQSRVRGALVSTDTSANSFVVNVEPFENESGDDGQFTVQTTSATTFAINGTSYTRSAGLTALASLAAGTMTAAYGTFDVSTKTFTASSVLAGSSVVGTKTDGVKGTVLARSGNTLTIANGLEEHAGMDDMGYVRKITATIGAATTVSELGQSGTFTVQDISVGQRIQLSGTLGTDSSGNKTIDATAGGALLMPTALAGTVSSTAANVVTLALQSLDGQAPAAFDFTGTGMTNAQDAAAAAYTVAVPAALSTGSLAAGVPVRFVGFVAPFGSAPPDFNAITVVNFANTKAELDVRWAPPGVAAPFATLTSTQILISQATLTASAEHELLVAFTKIDPSSLAAGLSIVPDMSATNVGFAIAHRASDKSDSYTTFNDFVTALTTDLNGTTAALGVEAVGPYDSTTGVLSVDRMVVILND